MNSPSTSDSTKKPTDAKWTIRPENTGFGKFIWNSEKNEFLGRTGSSWAKIGLFYVVFYSFLAGFFSILFVVFYQTIDDKEPTYVGVNASILRAPGLGFRPYVLELENKKHLLRYYTGDEKLIKQFQKDIDELLEPYRIQNDTYYQDCTSNKEDDRHCKVNLDELEAVCKPDNQWGFTDMKPIFFFKLNKMIGFMPEPLTDVTDLPESLKTYLTSNSLNVQDKVWVWCEVDDNTVTLEHASPGLSLQYYPYHFSREYLSPLSCVRISGLQDGKEVELSCKLWAKNIPETSHGRSTGRAIFKIQASTKKLE